MPDNGIKFLARGGVKLDDAIEAEIERHLHEDWDRPTGGAVGRVRTHPTAVEEYAAHLDSHAATAADRPARSCSTAPRARRTTPARGALREAGRHRDRDPRRARRAQHQRRLRLHPPRAAAQGRARARRRRRLRARRRRRPVPGGRPRRARSSTATRSSRSWRSAMAEAGQLAKNTVVATVMSNLGFVQAMKAAGVGRPADQGRRPLRPRGDEGVRLLPRRRAVRPRDHERVRHDRRRHPHRAARAGADGGHRQEPAGRSPRS